MNTNKNRPRPNKPEEKWVDYDEETACWGIFGAESGFCYSLWFSEKQAQQVLDDQEVEKELARGIN